MVSFRNINFFECNPLKDVEYYSSLSSLQNVRITSIAEGNNIVFLGDYEGHVFCFDKSLNMRHFRGIFSEIYLLKYNQKTDCLYTVSKVEGSSANVINIWNMKKWHSGSNPPLLKSITVTPKSDDLDVISCFDFTYNSQTLLIGNSFKSLEMFRGKFDRSMKHTLLRYYDDNITNLFVINNQSTQGETIKRSTVSFYLTTNRKIYYILLNKRDEFEKQIELDIYGCLPFRCVLYESENHEDNLIVARDEAIYFYSSLGKGQCFALPGEKSMIKMFKKYIIILYASNGELEVDEEIVVYNEHSISYLSTLSDQPSAKVQIFDFENKFFAGEFTMPFVCGLITSFERGIYLISSREFIDEPNNKNAMSLLTEKDRTSILEILFQKNRYDLALEYVNKKNLGDSSTSLIYCKHAEYLYQKKEFEESIKKYIKTIGYVDSSIVIQKFLDCNKIHELTSYLEAFHTDENIAHTTGNHTVLLLNCYIRLGDERKIINFILEQQDKRRIPKYDVYTVIKSLRRSLHHEAALELAKISGLLTEAVDILLIDFKDDRKAIDMLMQLDLNQAMKCLVKYGRCLFKSEPEVIENLLESFIRHPDFESISTDEFIKIFNDNYKALLSFLMRLYYSERYIEQDSDQWLVESLLDLMLSDYAENKRDKETGNSILKILSKEKGKYSFEKVLLMCKERDFIQGCRVIWKELNDWESLLDDAKSNEDFDQMLQLCKEYGLKNKDCYLNSLKYFSKKQPMAEKHLIVTLNDIDQHKLATPVNVLLLLMSNEEELGNNHCKISSIKSYLTNCLKNSRAQIEQIRSETSAIRRETARNRNFNKETKSRFVVYRQQKCSLCQNQLEVPSMHFDCDHSYHLACLDNLSDERSCVECLTKFKEELKVYSNQQDGFLDVNLLKNLKSVLSVARSGSFQRNLDSSKITTSKMMTKNISELVLKRRESSGGIINPFDSFDSGYDQSRSQTRSSISNVFRPKKNDVNSTRSSLNPFLEEEEDDDDEDDVIITKNVPLVTPIYQSVPKSSPFSMRATIDESIKEESTAHYPNHLNPF